MIGLTRAEQGWTRQHVWPDSGVDPGVADPGVDADTTSGAGNIFCVTRVFFNQRLHSQDGFCITRLNPLRRA